MRYSWRKRVMVPANWKTVIDAFIEGYHTPGTHPQVLRPYEGLQPSARPAPVEEYQFAPFTPTFPLGVHHSVFKYADRPASDDLGAEWADTTGRPDIYANLIQYLHGALGAMHTERDARAAERLARMDAVPEVPAIARHLALAEQLALEEGVDYPIMTLDEYFETTGGYHVFPTMVLLVEKGSVLGYRMRPNGGDPDSAIWDVFCLEHFAPRSVPETKWEIFPDWREADLGPFLAQDLKNLADIQAGMHSDGFAGLYLNSVQESSIMSEHRVADRYLFGITDVR
jgi:hypothetical protein